MTMKLALTVLLAGAAISQVEQAQSGAAALKESLAENQAKLRAYAWIETTQISLKGEVKKEEQSSATTAPTERCRRPQSAARHRPILKRNRPVAADEGAG